MKRTPDLINQAVRQMCKATHRGDMHAALRWLIIAERQLDIIDRLAGARRHRHVWRHRNELAAALEKAVMVTASQRSPDA
ncbi:MAG TPA: hypothetical protein VGO52_24065 [Hyphomonadaceae bacterium]|jgi:hypothetical protein|nr:hypothetical protein [Hyphomonadaceae bacterium]